MKKLLFTIAVAISFQALAQELPQASPKATISQQVGLTDFSISYSRPSVKNRDVFGDLIPFGKHWRLGANKNSTISFTKDAYIGETRVPAGTYSLSAIVNETNWTIILNSNFDMWGIDGYNSRKDVARVDLPVLKNQSSVETLYMGFEDITTEGVNLVISWKNSCVKTPIKVETLSQAQENIMMALDENPEDYRIKRNSARFYFQNNMDPNMTLELIHQVIKNDPNNWYSNYLYAQILASQGDHQGAKKTAKIALSLGRENAKEKNEKFNYEDEIRSFVKNL